MGEVHLRTPVSDNLPPVACDVGADPVTGKRVKVGRFDFEHGHVVRLARGIFVLDAVNVDEDIHPTELVSLVFFAEWAGGRLSVGDL